MALRPFFNTLDACEALKRDGADSVLLYSRSAWQSLATTRRTTPNLLDGGRRLSRGPCLARVGHLREPPHRRQHAWGGVSVVVGRPGDVLSGDWVVSRQQGQPFRPSLR